MEPRRRSRWAVVLGLMLPLGAALLAPEAPSLEPGPGEPVVAVEQAEDPGVVATVQGWLQDLGVL